MPRGPALRFFVRTRCETALASYYKLLYEYVYARHSVFYTFFLHSTCARMRHNVCVVDVRASSLAPALTLLKRRRVPRLQPTPPPRPGPLRYSDGLRGQSGYRTPRGLQAGGGSDGLRGLQAVRPLRAAPPTLLSTPCPPRGPAPAGRNASPAPRSPARVTTAPAHSSRPRPR